MGSFSDSYYTKVDTVLPKVVVVVVVVVVFIL